MHLLVVGLVLKMLAIGFKWIPYRIRELMSLVIILL